MKGYKIGFSDTTEKLDWYLCYALIELEVPEKYPGAKFYSFCGHNRTNVARVLRINKLVLCNPMLSDQPVKDTNEQMDSAFSIFDHNFYYHPGEIVYPDYFVDEMIMCTNGIHFFNHKQEAIDYSMNSWVKERFFNCALERICYDAVTDSHFERSILL